MLSSRNCRRRSVCNPEGLRRAAVVIALGFISAVRAAHAEDQKPPPSPPPLEINIGPSDGTENNQPSLMGSRGIDRCVDVQIGSTRAYDCLNSKLKDQVNRVNPGSIEAPLSAGSSDIKIGVVNIPAVQQQYGKNFGKSVYPYRPPPLIYGSGIGGGVRPR